MSIGSFVSGYVPMLMLGTFRFSLNVAVPQEIERSTEYKWPAQALFGQAQARQFVGIGDDTITLPGVIFPEWKGSTNAMKTLRGLAAQGQPLLLIDGMGTVYGRWVITRVDEKKSIFAAAAQPKKIEFSVTLQYFDGAQVGLLPDLSGTLLGAAISAI
jgi:phage protein U